MFAPSADIDAFHRGVALIGSSPTDTDHKGSFVVTLEPILGPVESSASLGEISAG